MKDKFEGKIIREFVELRLKMYSLVTVNNEETKNANGVNKNIVKNIRHRKYIDMLFNKKMIRHKMKRVQTKLHTIGTYNVCKISLYFFDDKRYILNDGINSLAFFFKDIRGQ